MLFCKNLELNFKIKMEQAEILIIGCGVVGLAVAKQVSDRHKDIFIIEKNKSFGQETSSRNSEVIHGGMYYPKGTLKSKMCVEGRPLLYEFCRKNKVPFKKTGKLIVATEKEELIELEKLLNQGNNNSVEGLRIVDCRELEIIEPGVNGISALYSPETGIVDSHRLMKSYLDIAKDNGVMPIFNSEVTGIANEKDGYRVTVSNNNEEIYLKTQIIINCSGLDSDNTAKMAGMDIEKLNYGLHYCKGQYFRVNQKKSSLINKLVYPVPKPKSAGLGIHATLDLSGSLRLGPDDNYLDSREKDYSVDDSRRPEFYLSAKKFLPFLEEADLSPDIAGIRPKLQKSGEAFRDFVIKDESENGLPGFINLIGIESPGLTASLAIGKYVGELINL